MKSKEYYTTFKETSKTFKLMGDAVGITATRRTQRGIIAKKYLEATQDFQLEQFAKKIPYFAPKKRIKVTGGGKTWFI